MNTLLAREAFTLHLPSDIPEEIQWMPPGEHTITARNSKGEPVTRSVRSDAATAARLQQILTELKSRASAQADDLPYIDFNHEDREAAGHILQFSWGGDDPVTGGIRARVRWSEPGRAALQGRAYRRFSPTFAVDADGEVVGASVNMGGLVNRAAFKTITPIWSRAGLPDGGEQITQQKGSDMSEPNKQLADLQTANADLQQQVTELNAKLASANQADVIKAKDAQIHTLTGQVTELNARLAAQAKAQAEGVVNAAIQAGKLAPQNTELKAKWIEILTQNPEMAQVLDAMAPSAALHRYTPTTLPNSTAPGSGEVTELKAREAAGMIEEYRAQNRCSYDSARQIIRSKRPDLFGL